MLEEVQRLLAEPATLTAEIVGEPAAPEAASKAEDAPSAAAPALEGAPNARAATHAGLANTVDKRHSRRAVAFVIMAALSLAVGVVAAIVLPSRFAKPQAPQHDGAATASERAVAPSVPSDAAGPIVSAPATPAAPSAMPVASAPVTTTSASTTPSGASAAPRVRPGKTTQLPASSAKDKSNDPFGGVAQ